MAEEERGKMDLATYLKMSEPFTTDAEADVALKGFMDAVEEAGKTFRIANVHVIVKMNLIREGHVGEVMTHAHWGNTLEGPVMCAWALGEERANARHILQKLLKP